MRFILKCLIWMFILGTPAMATPALVTRVISDGTGTHTQYFCDMSGTGAGPFQPIGATDAQCNQFINISGGGVGKFLQAMSDATAMLSFGGL